MYAVEVRDHIMIAHSFRGEVFGPAQRMHGATYVVDVAFFCEALTSDEIVVDIGRAHDVLKDILKPINYTNLDEVDAFSGRQTTTEFLSRHIFDKFSVAINERKLGSNCGNISRVRVTLHESHVARAWYEGRIT